MEITAAAPAPDNLSHPILGVLLIILVAILAAELTRRKRRLPSFLRVLIYTYSEFLLLGLAIGPLGFRLIDQDLLQSFEPFLHLSLGGVGLLYGLQFDYAHIRRFSPAMFRVTFFQAAFTAVVCVIVLFATALLCGFSATESSVLALVLAIIASASAPQVIAFTIQERGFRNETAHLLQFITAFDGIFGILALAVLVSAQSGFGPTRSVVINGILGLTLSLLVGFVCGVAFHWLTEIRASTQERTLYLLGLVTLGSGVAATLKLSPLFVNVVFGITVANISRRTEETFREMGRLEHPLFIVLLILVGARWRFTTVLIGPLILAYILSRMAGKGLGCWLGMRLHALYFEPPARLGLALTAQGGIALALLASLTLNESMPLIPTIETVVILSMIASEILSPPLTRNVMAHGGRWRTEP